MSQWSASSSQRVARAQHYDNARGDRPRPLASAANPNPQQQSAASAGAGYTIAHRGRQIRFGPVAFWIVVGTVVVLAGWSATTATYFAFSDDVIKGVLARQAEQQFAYEDRIAELRAQIDRTMSRQLLDQEQFEQKLNDLLRRQAALESRTSALGGITDPATTGSIKQSYTDSAAKASPTGDSMLRPQRLDRGTYLEPSNAPDDRGTIKGADIATKFSRIEASVDRVDHRQVAALTQMQDRYESKARRMRGILAELGLKVDAPPAGAVGGPFVPVKLPAAGQSFERAVTQVSIARAYADRLSATVLAIPLRAPVTGDIDETSPFGVRVDPFQHMPAMHTGIDFRGTMGEPIHVTASGTVTSAGWSGGYGNMVEVDHGNGLATRYGHLSAIDVKVGQVVRIGQVIGRLGSTGRSTGPHVHYETRVNGEAVNPAKFLNAGEELFGG
jgi:murein DD-endopeptidase MepM/ murein hydrolase activator NlpD